jgi:hypothetical protein
MTIIIIFLITNNFIPKKIIYYETIESSSNKMVDEMIELYKNENISVSDEDAIKKRSLEALIKMLESKGYTIE